MAYTLEAQLLRNRLQCQRNNDCNARAMAAMRDGCNTRAMAAILAQWLQHSRNGLQ